MSHIIEPIYGQGKWNAFVLTIEKPMLLNIQNIMLLKFLLKSTHITPHLSLQMVQSWNVEKKLFPFHILQSSSTLSLLFEISHKGFFVSEQPYVHISSFNLAQQCLHVLRTLVVFWTRFLLELYWKIFFKLPLVLLTWWNAFMIRF